VVALWSLQTSRTRWKFSKAESLFRCDVSCTRNSVGHTEFLLRRTSEIPMENFTCTRLLSALKGGRSGLRATSTLRALCVRVQSKRHAHTCNTATRLHDSNTARRCGHSAGRVSEYCTRHAHTCSAATQLDVAGTLRASSV
jgi:hypothetical protein